LFAPLGLEVLKIHAYPNDCILYRGDEYEKLDVCPVCGAKPYKIKQNDTADVDGPAKKKNPR
jgi:formate dehydrogenase maturation protein FdhE